MISNLPELLTPQVVSDLTGGQANANVIRRNCQAGRMPAAKINGHWYIPRDLVFSEIIKWEGEQIDQQSEKENPALA